MKLSKKENDLRPVNLLVSGLLHPKVTLFSSVLSGGDGNVGLSEKMEYIGGVVPRGLIAYTASKSVTGSSFSGDLISISGRGILTSAQISVDKKAYGYYGKIVITIDSEKTIILGDSSEFWTTSYPLGTLNVDLNSLLSACPEDYPITITDGKTYTFNKPFFFEKSLHASVILNGSNGNTTVAASLNYGLEV